MIKSLESSSTPMSKPTAFQQRVYDAVSQIPAGKVTTYKALADSIGCGSAQAVGQALKRNPNAPKVPCHRVINSQLNIGGYLGKTQGASLEKKRQLLAQEGVGFDVEGRLIDRVRVVGI